MVVRVALFGHREWAHRIFANIVLDAELGREATFAGVTTICRHARYVELGISDFGDLGVSVHRIDPDVDGRVKDQLDSMKADLNLFYGWSWILPSGATRRHMCICAHPSYLPKYRGGSPLQHQIINGEQEGGLTLFAMADGVDNGDIVAQARMSLLGDLSDIFDRMVQVGTALTKEIVLQSARGTLQLRPQNHAVATTFSRRAPAESEITVRELQVRSPQYVYNKIRALQDPYPNAYVSFPGTKVLLRRAAVVGSVSQGVPIIDVSTIDGKRLPAFLRNQRPFVLKSHGHEEGVLVTKYLLARDQSIMTTGREV